MPKKSKKGAESQPASHPMSCRFLGFYWTFFDFFGLFTDFNAQIPPISFEQKPKKLESNCEGQSFSSEISELKLFFILNFIFGFMAGVKTRC